MVKTERLQAEDIEPTPGRAWMIGAAAWFVPGLGHLMLARWGRAILMGSAVYVCFFAGIAMGGHLFPTSESSLLFQIPAMVGNLGTGVLYIIYWLLGVGFTEDPEQAARATYEYGYIFLIIAGLLNYLTMLDAFDIAAGRKS